MYCIISLCKQDMYCTVQKKSLMFTAGSQKQNFYFSGSGFGRSCNQRLEEQNTRILVHAST